MSRTESLREPRSRRGALPEGVAGEVRCRRGLAGALTNEKLSGWRQGPGRRLYESTRAHTAQRHLATVAAEGLTGKCRTHRSLRVCFTAAALRATPAAGRVTCSERSGRQRRQGSEREEQSQTSGYRAARQAKAITLSQNPLGKSIPANRAVSSHLLQTKAIAAHHRSSHATMEPQPPDAPPRQPLRRRLYPRHRLRSRRPPHAPPSRAAGAPSRYPRRRRKRPRLPPSPLPSGPLERFSRDRRRCHPRRLARRHQQRHPHRAPSHSYSSRRMDRLPPLRRLVPGQRTRPGDHRRRHHLPPRTAQRIPPPRRLSRPRHLLRPRAAGRGDALYRGLRLRPPRRRQTGGVRLLPRHPAPDLPRRPPPGGHRSRLPRRRGLLFLRARGRHHRIVLLQRRRRRLLHARGVLSPAPRRPPLPAALWRARRFLLRHQTPRPHGRCRRGALRGRAAPLEARPHRGGRRRFDGGSVGGGGPPAHPETRGAGAVLFVAAQRRWKPVLIVAAGAALMMAPWTLRALVLTGNPVAPLMNSVFPNPYFHIATERELAASLRSLGDVRPAQVPWELAFGDRLTGTFGPLLLALPIGLLALRRRGSRLLWAAAILLALPWIANTGARFLMPAVALAAIALGMALPRPVAWAAIALQAILCWPQVLDSWETRYSFRLHEFPFAAAIGAESEADYCRRRFEEYNVARMIQRATPPDSRTLALLSVASAYLDREVAVTWQSAEADRLLDTLRLASVYATIPTFDWKAVWGERVVRTLRFRMPAAYAGEWDINEVELFSGEDRLFNSPQWTIGGWPNRWEGPLAFDGNLATRWRTWETVRAGMYLDVELGNPQRLTAAVLVTHTPAFRVSLEIHGLDVKGQWHLLSNTPQAIPRPPRDIRLEADIPRGTR